MSEDVNSDYKDLLNTFFVVTNALQGTESDDGRLLDCQQLAAKLFYHAATILYLGQGRGTTFPLPALDQGVAFLDFASTAVLTRAAFDTYLAMFALYFDIITEDEREFRHAFWLLRGYVVRENITPTGPNAAGIKAAIDSYLAEQRARLRKTKVYNAMTARQRREVDRGENGQGKSWNNLAISAGFGPGFVKNMRRYYSSFVHSDGFSAAKIKDAETFQAMKDSIQFDMRNVMMVLAKAIIAYADRFPVARQICETIPVSVVRAEFYSKLASRMP